MAQNLKVVIPMAGWGTRMRPHTWNKPKPLVSVAGKTSLDHLMDMFATLPDFNKAEFIFIVSPYLGELQIPAFILQNYPDIKAAYVTQAEMKGQSHALLLAKEYLEGPMIMCFSDTLMETDFSFLANETADGVAWVKPVPDPRRFGVAELNAEGHIKRLIEKPKTTENNLAVVGCYYFKSSEALVDAIEEQIERDISLKGEYFLADAINIMLEKGNIMRTEQIEIWMDTGTIESTLDTNTYMLQHGRDNSAEAAGRTGVTIVPPVFIHASAQISDSVIGPNVSIGPDCEVNGCIIRASIVDDEAVVTDSVLSGSFIGRQAKVEGRAASINIGDNSTLRL